MFTDKGKAAWEYKYLCNEEFLNLTKCRNNSSSKSQKQRWQRIFNHPSRLKRSSSRLKLSSTKYLFTCLYLTVRFTFNIKFKFIYPPSKEMAFVKVVYSIKMQNKSKQFKTIKNRSNTRISGSLIYNYTQWNLDFGSTNINNLPQQPGWLVIMDEAGEIQMG